LWFISLRLKNSSIIDDIFWGIIFYQHRLAGVSHFDSSGLSAAQTVDL